MARPFGRNSRRFLLSAVIVSAFAWCLPTFAGSLQQGLAGLADLLVDRLAREQARSANLDAEIGACVRRIEGRNQAIELLVRGELTLWEAAARFRELDGLCPDKRRATILFNAGRSDADGVGRTYEECLCWNVIGYLEVEERGKLISVSPRLKEQLRRQIASGTLTLPE
jgi:hypothetical protein